MDILQVDSLDLIRDFLMVFEKVGWWADVMELRTVASLEMNMVSKQVDLTVANAVFYKVANLEMFLVEE